MNKQQRTAIDHPCRLAVEAGNPLFHKADGLWRVHMSVNSGYE